MATLNIPLELIAHLDTKILIDIFNSATSIPARERSAEINTFITHADATLAEMKRVDELLKDAKSGYDQSAMIDSFILRATRHIENNPPSLERPYAKDVRMTPVGRDDRHFIQATIRLFEKRSLDSGSVQSQMADVLEALLRVIDSKD